MNKPEIGEVWYVNFPFEEKNEAKARPAFVIDEFRMAILAVEITSVSKPEDPYRIEIRDWQQAGLKIESYARIDRIEEIEELNILRKIGSLSDRDKIKVFQLVYDINSEKSHDFSLVAIKNEDNKYLQKYVDSWNCWLFPYFRTEHEDNKSNVDSKVSELFGKKICTNFLRKAVHCKFSQKDSRYKAYNHMLYEYKPTELPDNMKIDTFEIDGTKYKWMTIEEMVADERIFEVNSDIIGFVKTYCK